MARGFQWYVVNVYSGFENKVIERIKELAAKKGLSEYFEETLVPSEEVVEVRRGKKVNTQKNYFPGYILLKMKLTDDAWHLVLTVDRVAGFLGASKKGDRPLPISQKEVDDIMNRVQEAKERPRHQMSFEIGEVIKVCDGPFNSFSGVVDEIDDEKGRLKVSVTIFGRPTPVELEYSQVEKQ